MSDLANTFYAAWCNVFTVPEKRLYCTWLMDKAWKKKLKEMLPCSNPKQAEIYAFLSTLKIEMNEANFRKMLTEFNDHLKEECSTFCDYFMNTRMLRITKCRCEQPAFAKAVLQTQSTNMYAKAFHRVLEDI